MPRIDKTADLQRLVDEFVKIIGYDRTPGYHRLIVSSPYYPYDHVEGKLNYPHPGEPGCYVFTAGDGTPIYVGKASKTLAGRTCDHAGRKREPGGKEPFPNAKQFVKDNQPDIAVWAIPLLDAHWFLAPALEGFLTEKLLGKRT